METKIRSLIRLLGSGWFFGFTLLLFVVESGWLALTAGFPMAYDEAYHLGLIRVFSHHLSPIITSQASDTYKFGAIIQNPSFLYHYLLSLPYRFMTLLTHDMGLQVIGLRLINVAIAVASLVVMKRLLRLMNLSDAKANMLILVFALTPLFMVLSAQINYDNLLILAVVVSTYETMVFLRRLDQGVFDTKRLLILLSLCLFSSLIKFAFLPIFAAIAGIIAWKTGLFGGQGFAKVRTNAKSGFAKINRHTRLLLVFTVTLGGFLFVRFYVVNSFRYHNPVPQCNQVLNVHDCKSYYAWESNYLIQRSYKMHGTHARLNVAQYGGRWLTINTFELFAAVVPLAGIIYAYEPYFLFVFLLGTAAFVCTVRDFGKIAHNRDMNLLLVISLVYILSLWARNYHDYMQTGMPVALHGRYLLPVLMYLYVMLGLGLDYALTGWRAHAREAKTALAVVIIVAFVAYGGARQYVTYVYPEYGRLSRSTGFNLPDNTPAKND